MLIPDFPKFTAPDLSHREHVNNVLSSHPLEASEYTFTNLFAFRSAYNFRLSLLWDNLIILADTEPAFMLCPAGSSRIPDVLDAMFEYLKSRTDTPFLERVPESFADTFLKSDPRFTVKEERDHFDYMYDVNELIELKGKKFHDKKNRVNTFRKSYNYEYQSLTPDLIEECIEFEDYWCEDRDCEKHSQLEKEKCAILEMLKNFGSLDIKGGIIRIEDRIAALTLGEKTPSGTLVVHVEKAHTGIAGLYQVINQEFLINEAGGCRFVNREQDLGIEGLRNAKMSYNPVTFIKKYQVRKNSLQR